VREGKRVIEREKGHSMLQRVAVCCSVLQCVAASCSKRVIERGNVNQNDSGDLNKTLFFERERERERERKRERERETLDCDGDGDLDGSFFGDCNTLQDTATHCNTLQNTATHGSLSLSLFPSFFLSPTYALFLSLSSTNSLSYAPSLSRAQKLQVS